MLPILLTTAALASPAAQLARVADEAPKIKSGVACAPASLVLEALPDSPLAAFFPPNAKGDPDGSLLVAELHGDAWLVVVPWKGNRKKAEKTLERLGPVELEGQVMKVGELKGLLTDDGLVLHLGKGKQFRQFQWQGLDQVGEQGCAVFPGKDDDDRLSWLGTDGGYHGVVQVLDQRVATSLQLSPDQAGELLSAYVRDRLGPIVQRFGEALPAAQEAPAQ